MGEGLASVYVEGQSTTLPSVFSVLPVVVQLKKMDD